MNTNNSVFAPLDQDTERRRVLAKIYSILIRLSDELEEVSDGADADSKAKNLETIETKPEL